MRGGARATSATVDGGEGGGRGRGGGAGGGRGRDRLEGQQHGGEGGDGVDVPNRGDGQLYVAAALPRLWRGGGSCTGVPRGRNLSPMGFWQRREGHGT